MISNRFVELLGGSIWAESEVGRGSTFHLCLPLYPNVPTSKGGSAEASPRMMSPGPFLKHYPVSLMAAVA